ncbi:MAG TPA: malto-oligosyltrehalose trehalohydrolase [Stellaceae bacterium]|nr:malto-oligosyltrehalose trehalohydrolase [Stellaceae bacterium]
MESRPAAPPAPPSRRLPVGAEALPLGGVHFRVWAPAAKTLAVAIEGQAPRRLAAEPGGYFAGGIAGAKPGERYRFLLDDDRALPDPASRFQPEGPHGPSEIVDPAGFAWSDHAWRGLPPERLVIYELHVGTFTAEGSWQAAMARLPDLAEIGITCIEMMPVADFPGDFGWGYDGVDLFAPTRLYGRPDDLRRFVDRAHGLGIAVILDVVYNHLGPDGNYLTAFAPGYVTDRYDNEWGAALNFDGADAAPAREFFIANAGYWIDEYHFDGLRLDATQQIFDASPEHVLAAIGERARAAGAGRRIFLAAENEAQTARLVRPRAAGGYGLDALWNDDFHHSAMVALTGRNEAYYSDFRGRPGEFVAAAKHGYLYQGQWFAWQNKPRGTPARDLSPTAFVTYLQNHDQVANSGAGLRGHQLASPGAWRAMTACLLLMPGLPMLFQGQEFAASAPFLYFADHRGELGRLVRRGRAEFLTQFASLRAPEMAERFADPGDRQTFRRCVLDWDERTRHAPAVALHRDLIALRRRMFADGPPSLDGAVLAEACWLLRYFGKDGADFLVIVNLGRDLHLRSVAEPLTAPLEGCTWRLAWSSEDAAYDGGGVVRPIVDGTWHIAGRSAVVLETAEGALAAGVNPVERRTA